MKILLWGTWSLVEIVGAALTLFFSAFGGDDPHSNATVILWLLVLIVLGSAIGGFALLWRQPTKVAMVAAYLLAALQPIAFFFAVSMFARK
jgi:hypothetical protein